MKNIFILWGLIGIFGFISFILLIFKCCNMYKPEVNDDNIFQRVVIKSSDQNGFISFEIFKIGNHQYLKTVNGHYFQHYLDCEYCSKQQEKKEIK